MTSIGRSRSPQASSTSSSSRRRAQAVQHFDRAGVNPGQLVDDRSLGGEASGRVGLRHVGDEPGQPRLPGGGGAKGGPQGGLLLDGLHHPGMGMAQNQWAPGEDIVNILVAVLVPDMRAPAPLDKERCATHATKSPHRAVHPPHQMGLGLLKELPGALSFHLSAPE